MGEKLISFLVSTRLTAILFIVFAFAGDSTITKFFAIFINLRSTNVEEFFI